ncbi:hypothetical protein BU25DRAFT_455960 [Macroventuria anomochaeta]|uniref:Uncharacterized protein n=1 Tax=Macroventuria anomochaeta TaxID=301207 RepID=A0ACB6S9G0_9PLEO|nr:uncharacterized protein BU25DRAFT_455960 [Macroventuria anomochaeta]KAF2630905.1 hypothetical protein BU25DRAFT_455960 [Macroventuria anomochaeta]
MVNTTDFLNMPLTINGTIHSPLQHHYLDQAERVLDPGATACLSSLLTAFGLGDGHGRNVLVTEDYISPGMMHLDYEVYGSHCPLLDMAKSIYNDGFFNVLYSDLLCDDLTESSNKSGTVVSWDFNTQGLSIDYKVSVDSIGKATANIKFEYLLQPLFNLVQRHPKKASVAQDILSNSLFTCALLSRKFAKRPDVFFIKLALGVRLRIVGLDLEKRVSFEYLWILTTKNVSDGAGFLDLGHYLYNEDKASSGHHFFLANMLDPSFKDKARNLQHRFHFVHTANVIHLFNVEDQKIFFQNLVYLAAPGGTIWGRQVGLAEDNNQSLYKQPAGKGARFTIIGFRNFLLEATGWTLADMQFEAQLVEYHELRVKRMDKNWVLQWSILLRSMNNSQNNTEQTGLCNETRAAKELQYQLTEL